MTRRKRRWPPYRRKRSPFGRKRGANRTWIEEYEHSLILADMALWEPGWIITAKELQMRVPGRYDKRYLKSALDRMVSRGIIRSANGRGRWIKGNHYIVPERAEAAIRQGMIEKSLGGAA